MAVFSGHDHGVDWCMKWAKDLPDTSPKHGNGLNICFNRSLLVHGFATAVLRYSQKPRFGIQEDQHRRGVSIH